MEFYKKIQQSLWFLLVCSQELAASVIVENDSLKPILVALVRTKMSLSDRHNKLYLDPQENEGDLKVYSIAPGSFAQISNYPAAYTKYDRDIWVTFDPRPMIGALKYGIKGYSSAVTWYNVGGTKNRIFIGGNDRVIAPKIFTSRKEALRFTGSSITVENLAQATVEAGDDKVKAILASELPFEVNNLINSMKSYKAIYN